MNQAEEPTGRRKKKNPFLKKRFSDLLIA